ncbi:MAG: methyltransferase [Polyangiales bacterium]
MLASKRFIACCLLAGAAAGCGGSAAKPPASAAAANNAEVASTDAIAQAVASAVRTPDNRARDPHRHPYETLRFFDIQPTQTVVELWPGRGWYTEVLAPLLREQGALRVAVARGNYLAPYKEFLAKQPTAFDRVEVVEVEPPGTLSLGPDGSADAVLTFRNLHGWIEHGYAEQVHAAIFKVLKPGGVYGVEEHRAKPGATLEDVKSGYVSEEQAIALATAAGLVLEERSEINANPKDTKDYPNGVWSLPPTLQGKDVDRDKFVAIGESDRMTLRFRKPK